MAKSSENSPRDHLRQSKRGAGGIQSIEIGALIIEALKIAEGPQTLKELCTATGLGSSSCHRYLTSFVRIDYVRQDPETNRYELGPSLMHAGLRAVSRVDAIRVGERAAARLSLETGRTVNLAIWSDVGPVVVDWRIGKQVVRTNISVGSVVPVMTSATGQAMLSFLPASMTEHLILSEGYTIEDIDEVKALVQARNYSMMGSSIVPGLTVASAPIRNCKGMAEIAVSLVGLSDGLRDSELDLLVQITRSASRELGWA